MPDFGKERRKFVRLPPNRRDPVVSIDRGKVRIFADRAKIFREPHKVLVLKLLLRKNQDVVIQPSSPNRLDRLYIDPRGKIYAADNGPKRLSCWYNINRHCVSPRTIQPPPKTLSPA